MKIKTGDKVIVISGKDSGKSGKVLRVWRDIEKVLVEGINIRKKLQKNKEGKKERKLVEVEYPIHVSNIMLVDEKSGKGSRVSIKRDEKGKRVRVLKKSGVEIK